MDLIITTKRKDVLEWFLKALKNEKDPGVRYHQARQFSLRPPFLARQIEHSRENHPMNTPELVHELWNLISKEWIRDIRTMTTLVDAYSAMYGRKETPHCLSDRPIAVNSTADFSDMSMDLDAGEFHPSSSENEAVKEKKEEVPTSSVAELIEQNEREITGNVSVPAVPISGLPVGPPSDKPRASVAIRMEERQVTSLSDEDL